MGFYNLQKALHIFGNDTPVEQILKTKQLPVYSKAGAKAGAKSGGRRLKSWSCEEMPEVGQQIGFMKKTSAPLTIAIFVTKGGVLKSSLTLNMARMFALHGLKTCVIGLDMQGDISSALGADRDIEDSDDWTAALEKMNARRGLADFFQDNASLEEVIQETELPTLQFIPETPELVALDQSLINRNRREYWLKDCVLTPLKNKYDVILLDCSPNWNRLITNALVGCDILLSPLECKINNYRNFNTFRCLISEFTKELKLEFKHYFVPTRLSPARKLSFEIYQWYIENLQHCSQTAIRDSIQGEEAVAMRLSLPEFAPTSAAAEEIRAFLKEFWRFVGSEKSTFREKINQGNADLSV